MINYVRTADILLKNELVSGNLYYRVSLESVNVQTEKTSEIKNATFDYKNAIFYLKTKLVGVNVGIK
ncbi:MAG: hypothetical protein ACI8TE_000807 [Francisella sp.]|jgi:hypothetical protein